MTTTAQKKYWDRRARRLRLSINLGWFFSYFAPVAFATTLVAIAPLLWLRGTGGNELPFWLGYTGILFLAAILSFFRAGKKFENDTDAFARLDNTLHLRNRLTSANAGMGDFPPVENDTAKKPFRWNLGRTGGLIFSSIALLAIAATVPVLLQANDTDAAKLPSTEIPPPLAEINLWTRQLEAEKIVEQSAIEALRDKVDALLQYSKNDWYKASALEAAEHLNAQTAQTLQNLEKDLAAIENAIAQAQAFREQMPEELARNLQTNLDEALKGIDTSALPLTPEQRDSLRNSDMKSLSKMTPEDLQKMRENLKKNRASLAKNDGLKKSGNGGKDGANGTAIPAFIFANTLPDPLDRMLALIPPEHATLVRGAMAPMSDEDYHLLETAAEKFHFQAYAEEGCVPEKSYEGIVVLPNFATVTPLGVIDEKMLLESLENWAMVPANVDETTLLKVLQNLILPDDEKLALTQNDTEVLLQALRENRLRRGNFQLGQCNGNPNGTCVKLGAAQGQCQIAGADGKGGGGGNAPLTFNKKPTELETNGTDAISAKDRENDALGEMKAITLDKHEVDETLYQGATTGGDATDGTGGDAVWVDNLSPAERAALKEYFK